MNYRLALAGTAFLVAVSSMAGGWKLSLGVGYRTFDDVDFAPLALALPGSSGTYVNGDYIDAGNYTILNDSQLQQAGWTYKPALNSWTRKVTFDQVSFAGGSEGMDDAPGLVLEAERVLATGKGGWEVGLVLGLAAYWSDMSASVGNDELTINTLSGTLYEPGGPLDDPGVGYPAVGTSVGGSGPDLSTPDGLDPAGATTSSRLGLDTDLGLYVFSLGVRGSCSLGPVRLCLSGGPTVSVADFETSVDQTVVFLKDGTLVYQSSQSDSTVDVLLGAYVGADVVWMFRETWAVRAGARWDEVFDEVETDQASMDLSGMTASLALVWMF